MVFAARKATVGFECLMVMSARLVSLTGSMVTPAHSEATMASNSCWLCEPAGAAASGCDRPKNWVRPEKKRAVPEERSPGGAACSMIRALRTTRSRMAGLRRISNWVFRSRSFVHQSET